MGKRKGLRLAFKEIVEDVYKEIKLPKKGLHISFSEIVGELKVKKRR